MSNSVSRVDQSKDARIQADDVVARAAYPFRGTPWFRPAARVMWDGDIKRLNELIDQHRERRPEAAAGLLQAIAEADKRAAADLPPNIVRVGSRVVCFESNGSRSRYHHLHVVEPDEAEPSQGRVSVLSSLAAALIGLRPGQSTLWRNGPTVRLVTVLEVEAPASAHC